MTPGRTKFETILHVRPDDIDLNRHVHAPKYQDYVLAARYDQMARCYGMPMEDFEKLGLGWFVNTAHLEYKRALKLGDSMRVLTWVQEFRKDGVIVHFEILRDPLGKHSCEGWFHYTLVNTATGRAEPVPAWIAEKFAV